MHGGLGKPQGLGELRDPHSGRSSVKRSKSSMAFLTLRITFGTALKR